MAVSETSTSTTEWKTEKLERISYIKYPVIIKDQTEVLLDLRSKVNAMSQDFTHQLDFQIQKTNVRVQMMEGIIVEIYEMVIFKFSVPNKNGKERFFENSFLLVNFKPDVILGILFLTMSNFDVDF